MNIHDLTRTHSVGHSLEDIKVQFKNNDRNGIDLVINSGRIKGTKGHAELSVSSLEGLEVNTYAGHNVTLINGLRRAHFICE